MIGTWKNIRANEYALCLFFIYPSDQSDVEWKPLKSNMHESDVYPQIW